MDTISTDNRPEPDTLSPKGPGSGRRKKCPNCGKSFASKHPLGLCKSCGGGGIKCVLEKCNDWVEWVGYAEGNKDKNIPYKPGTPCSYCYTHRHRLEPSPFRNSFDTDFNEQRHGWRQTVSSNDFPITEGEPWR